MKKTKRFILVLVVVIMTLSFPISASAATVNDVTAKMEDAGAPTYYVNLFSNFLKSQSLTSTQADQLIYYIDKVAGVVAGRDPYSLSQTENLAVMELGVEAAQAMGLTMTYKFLTDGPGAIIYIWDKGEVVLQFGTRDTGIVQTGYAELTPIVITILLSAAIMYIVMRRRKCEKA